MKISVLIPTRNRPEKLKDCLNSVLVNKFRTFEIIVVDQSSDSSTEKAVKHINSKKVIYIRMKARGKSKALNLGLKKTSGEIIAFTDDDCVVSKTWLKNIFLSFQKNKDIIGLFGKILPFEPRLNRGKICPCTFLKKTETIIEKPCLHWKNIGFGGNMSFRKNVFEKVGNFREWLGPGSCGLAAVDAEFALRVLLCDFKILYNPHIRIYHNCWLSSNDIEKKALFYSCGEVACYGYFAFKGLEFGKVVLKDNFNFSLRKLKVGLKSLILFKKHARGLIKNSLLELFFKLRGFMVGFYFSKQI